MKRTLIAAAAVLAAGTAFAQSSVQIYGRVNTTVERLKDSSGTTTAMVNNASRWGLRGSEDMGSGLKGLFVLESGFNSDTGAGASRLFGRESWVGVESSSFGRVRLGNMGQPASYYATADYISMHNHDTGTSEDAFYLYPGRKQNMVSYNTPSFGGLVIEAQYSFKQDASNVETTTGQHTGVLVANYDRGPLHLGASYTDGPTGFSFAVPVGAQTFTDSKEYGLRALYELGPLTVGAYYVRNNMDGGTGVAETKRNAYRLAAMYTFGGSEVHLNVGYADNVKVAGVKQDDTSAKQYTVAYNYNLSKRTKVYALYTRIDNSARANYGNAREFGTVGAGFDPSSFGIGLRHAF